MVIPIEIAVPNLDAAGSIEKDVRGDRVDASDVLQPPLEGPGKLDQPAKRARVRVVKTHLIIHRQVFDTIADGHLAGVSTPPGSRTPRTLPIGIVKGRSNRHGIRTVA